MITHQMGYLMHPEILSCEDSNDVNEYAQMFIAEVIVVCWVNEQKRLCAVVVFAGVGHGAAHGTIPVSFLQGNRPIVLYHRSLRLYDITWCYRHDKNNNDITWYCPIIYSLATRQCCGSYVIYVAMWYNYIHTA